MEDQFKKLITLKDDPVIGFFDEIRELNDLLKKVVSAIEESKTTEVSILNQEQPDFSSVEEGLGKVVEAIGGIKFPEQKETKIDLSGVERLLNKISEKKDKEVDVSELKNISRILGDVLFAAQSISSKEEKEVDLSPLYSILSLINENIVAIDFPDFDYERLERAIKGIDINISAGGGSTAKLEQQITNVTLNNAQLKTTSYDSFGRENSLPFTAFGDLRTSDLSPVIQLSFEYTVDNSNLVTPVVTNTGTITQVNAMAQASTGTTTASIAKMICHQHARYRAGLGGVMRFTAMFTTGVANTSQWAGLLGAAGSSADFLNGFAIGYNGATFGIARFSNDALNFVALSACDDPLDGTGASGFTLDPTKLNVFFIQYQYLGAGAIRFYVENGDGLMVLFHTIEYTNTATVPSIYNPNLHLAIYANNKTTTSNLTVSSASMAFFVEGKTNDIETQQYCTSGGRVTKNTVTTETALFTIRNRSTYAGKSNLISVIPQRLSIGVQAANPQNLAQYRVLLNATLGGTPAYANVSTNNSLIEIDTAGTTVTGGYGLFSGDLAGQNDKIIENISDYGIYLHPGDALTVSVISANSATFNGSIMVKELF